MSSHKPVVRKIIYLLLVGALLIPLSLIAQPETRDGSGNIANSGGRLAILREKYDLSQAKLSEIDPASETMKLASLGLRGIAVNMLWLQANEQKKKENYEQLASTLKALTKIQPNFVKVWDFQAHNLAYNVSVEFDDYEYRYHWVKKGLAFLKEGIAYNKTDHRMTDYLGFYTGHKIAKSDEKESFRRLFRKDHQFHQTMADYIEPETYDPPRGYGPDNWLMAYQWYNYSRQTASKIDRRHTSDMLFFMHRPAQLRLMGISLQNEFRTRGYIQEVWRRAHEEWLDYGNEPLKNSLGVTVTLESMTKIEKEMEEARRQLDELAPNVRKNLIEKLKDEAKLSDEEMAAWRIPFDERNDAERRLARYVNQIFQAIDSQLDAKVALKVDPSHRLEANRLVEKINELFQQMQMIDRDSGTMNYAFWKLRTEAEATDIGVRARQILFDAQEMKRRSIYDDEFDRDFLTKKITITQKGAISLYLDAFKLWKKVLDLFPDLKEGPLADELVEQMHQFQEMLDTTHRTWPDDFPLQDLIDYRETQNEQDGLPTSEDVEEMKLENGSVDGEDDAGQDETGEDEAGQDESGEDETGQDETGQDEEGQDETGKAETGQAETGLLKVCY